MQFAIRQSLNDVTVQKSKDRCFVLFLEKEEEKHRIVELWKRFQNAAL